MRQYIVTGSDSKDEILYVVKSNGVVALYDAFRKVADIMGLHNVVSVAGPKRDGDTRWFLCSMDLSADDVREQIEKNALGEAGRGVYEVEVKELVENVNLA
jgi:hypothetical protein